MGGLSSTARGKKSELRIAVLGGDGIGPEVTAAAMQVLEAAVRDEGVRLKLDEHPVGWTAVLETGSPLPKETLAACVAADRLGVATGRS